MISSRSPRISNADFAPLLATSPLRPVVLRESVHGHGDVAIRCSERRRAGFVLLTAHCRGGEWVLEWGR